MRTHVRPRRLISAGLHALLAPAFWLERTRGRVRLALAVLYLLLVVTTATLGWRAASLWWLPDIGEPFDVRALQSIEVADDQNAFVFYRQASARTRHLRAYEKPLQKAALPWSTSGPALQRLVEENIEALDLYRQGSERPHALYVHPRNVTFDTPLPIVTDLRDLARLARLEGSRLEEAGDMAGAWVWYRAILRSSRHVGMHGVSIARLIGAVNLRLVAPSVTNWAADPRVDAPLLRGALADLAACEAMTPPVSDAIEMEYLSLDRALQDPQRWVEESRRDDLLWYHHLPSLVTAKVFLNCEPERSRRVVALVFANWLVYCDKPPAERPKFITTDPQLYAVDPSAPALARALAPQAITRWVKSTLVVSDSLPVLSDYLPTLPNLVSMLDADRPLLETLQVQVAEQLYLRENGKVPESAAVLVGPYLKWLPERYLEPDPSSKPVASPKAR
ncbi:MAG TPA: hypothetical protein VGZ22_13530 [Isosphaeraceae bacterium]|jgi:hypothetical protein|nr:hypothetical protein [Isosphaeraceae bacterium]